MTNHNKHVINPLIAGPDYIRVFHFLSAHKYQFFNIIKIQLDINQRDFKIVDLHFIESE